MNEKGPEVADANKETPSAEWKCPSPAWILYEFTYFIEDKRDVDRVFMLNILAPGFGTVLAGLLTQKNCWSIVIIGHLQMLLTPLILGWVWSILIGIRFRNIHTRGERPENKKAKASGQKLS